MGSTSTARMDRFAQCHALAFAQDYRHLEVFFVAPNFENDQLPGGAACQQPTQGLGIADFAIVNRDDDIPAAHSGTGGGAAE